MTILSYKTFRLIIIYSIFLQHKYVDDFILFKVTYLITVFQNFYIT